MNSTREQSGRGSSSPKTQAPQVGRKPAPARALRAILGPQRPGPPCSLCPQQTPPRSVSPEWTSPGCHTLMQFSYSTGLPPAPPPRPHNHLPSPRVSYLPAPFPLCPRPASGEGWEALLPLLRREGRHLPGRGPASLCADTQPPIEHPIPPAAPEGLPVLPVICNPSPTGLGAAGGPGGAWVAGQQRCCPWRRSHTRPPTSVREPGWGLGPWVPELRGGRWGRRGG